MSRLYAPARYGALVRLIVLCSVVLAACGPGEPTADDASPVSSQRCADVIAVELQQAQGGTYRASVTVRSDDIGWDGYADAWEVRNVHGEVLGTRVLAHPHVDEQPFTRSLADLEIPAGTTHVVVAARDSVNGFCGKTLEVEVG